MGVGGATGSNETQSRKEGEEEQVQKPARARVSRWQSEEEANSAREATGGGEIEKWGQEEEGSISEEVLRGEIEKARHQMQTNMEIMLQEKMQMQQEQELQEVSKMSVVRKHAAEIEARRTRPH